MALAVPLAARVARLQALGPFVRDGADAPVSARARAASAEALDRGETHYTDRPGIVPLREIVARRLSERFGFHVNGATDVVITCGVTEARFVAVQQLIPAHTGTVVALSHAERITAAAVVRDVVVVGPDADPVGPALVYLTSDAAPAVRERWLARAIERDWAVAYEAGDDDTFHPAAHGAANLTVTLGAIGASDGLEAWRVGYLAAPAKRVGPLRDFKQALTLCTTNLSQWGALALLEEGAS
jgi:aspartate/methionine/tyrosine aminotransferase